MPYRAQIDDKGIVARYKDTDTGEVISAKEFERRIMMQQGGMSYPGHMPQMQAMPPNHPGMVSPPGMVSNDGFHPYGGQGMSPLAPQPQGQFAPVPPPPPMESAYGQQPMPQHQQYQQQPQQQMMPQHNPMIAAGGGGVPAVTDGNPLVQPGAQMLNGGTAPSGPMPGIPGAPPAMLPIGQGAPPTAGQAMQGKTLRMEGIPGHTNTSSHGYKTHGFLDATSIAILLPTLVLLALIIAAAHKKRLFPWQTIRTFNPPSGLLSPRDYERSFVCPPNLRRHGRLGKRNPQAAWSDQDGIVLPFGFLARTHLPITIPLGRLPNKNMFIVAPSGSGKTTLMRAVIKALLAKPCVIIALEAKANDPALDQKKESFKFTLLPEALHAGFDPLYFNPLDADSIHWNPLDLDPISFASSIVQDVNSLPPEEQHWAERDHGYIYGLAQLLKWGAVMVAGEDENGQTAEVVPLPCNPRGLMRLVNNRRNIVESLRRLKSNTEINSSELNELTQTLSSIIRTDSDWDKNIQGVRGRLRMFKNPNVLRCTEASNIDIRAAMHKPTVLIFGAPASMGPDAESLASCFVYQLQQALHTRYGTNSVLPLFAFFDEYQTLNMDIAGRLSAIVRGANGGLTVILQNISQIAKDGSTGGANPASSGASELKTIFSNSAVRVCLHNADESTAKFFSDEIGKHAIIVPGVSDHYDSNGFGIFPTSWNRIHSQQVVPRVDADSIKRMEKHHALVYLSPAGDPEFGELKPFMCDLRGIEEIARLHLLHNVTSRTPQGDGGDGNGNGGQPVPGLPPGVVPQGGPGGLMPQGAPAGMLGQGGPAGMPGRTPQPMLANGQGAGQAIGAVAPALAGVAGVAQGVAGIAPGLANAAAMAGPAAMGVGAAAGVAAIGAAAAGAMAQRPPYPGMAVGGPGNGGGIPTSQAPMPQAPITQAPMPQAPMPQAPMPQAPMAQAPMPQAAPSNGVPSAERLCTKCNKWPGKGRFCIECGTFVGPQPGAPANGVPSQPMQNGAPTGQMPAPQQGRQPLTSLHNDMTQYGVPGQATAPQPGQPGQQPIPRPQQRGTGIEF